MVDYLQAVLEVLNFWLMNAFQECTYSISIKSDDFLISPASKEIHIKNKDITDIEFSAFKVITGKFILIMIYDINYMI